MQDTKYMTALEKEKVLRDWERFLKSGLKQERFTQDLYHHLIQHCSFIAHYNRDAFYATYFEDGDGKVLFLSQFDERNAGPDGTPPSVEYGRTDWGTGNHEDINKAMIATATAYIPALLQEANEQQKASDVTKARALLARHGM